METKNGSVKYFKDMETLKRAYTLEDVLIHKVIPTASVMGKLELSSLRGGNGYRFCRCCSIQPPLSPRDQTPFYRGDLWGRLAYLTSVLPWCWVRNGSRHRR
ncbi:hypothetical protein KKF84_07210 [Myxococcota bacterium]|nr:hypothetical protein [Myxococcota bacterium]